MRAGGDAPARFALDWIVIGATVLSIPAGAPEAVFALSLLLPAAYFTVLHGLNGGRTLGKLAEGVAVRLPDGGKIGLGRAFARAVAQSLLWLTVIGAWSTRSRRWATAATGRCTT